ncbi:Mrp/NBP35 family ATP-binding protein [Abyssibius alkaniclasticus]|uniref:Mrp/NBP35 family ATP-binding protein n=1 Tax=Abyssibius alkaniclasticus TaxID=2881234 RepID=UPI004059E88C
MTLNRDDILATLAQIIDPNSGKDIVAADYVRGLTIDGADVRFVLEVPPQFGAKMEPLRAVAERAVAAMDGVGRVSVLLTAHEAKAPPPDLKIGRHPTAQQGAGKARVPGVKHLVAIGSGKGGVGKSTVSSNLAVALAAQGLKVGLLDADVYGPSQPRMMGVNARPKSPDGKTIIPLRAHGVVLMSMGFMIGEAEAVIWRGPMLMGALQQLLGQVEWGALDVLLIDLPPGTGDVQLTLGQRYEVTGAVIVSTPQDVALLDARKAIDMFKKLDVPVLGMIENMSTHICRNCGHEEQIFGHGGARAEAEAQGMAYLGALPLDLDIRLAGDGGTPIAAARPDSAQARGFAAIAAELAKKLR